MPRSVNNMLAGLGLPGSLLVWRLSVKTGVCTVSVVERSPFSVKFSLSDLLCV